MNLQTMHDALDTLETSLQGEDHDTSERLMAEHLEAVAALSLIVERPSDAAILALRDHQQRVLARMISLRDEAAAHLKHTGRSLRAAHAYLQAESLA
ncbi:hypothetical protein R1L06_00035 [Stenotrophomonas sp. C4297]|uniref:hypothetical protein n=1 Tax=Stenotrophomonas sp. C4297 TaxID=3077847 RepID=UPI00293C6920|nr:hypothetical protein [Stenotrophomonas sp. C4297]MDV3509093.1 hypothetical protein [Stenotrophomonas sp. C4297]HEL4832638.1 hypothetical protein [Stenotrophomonas maltophilia]